MTIGWPMSETFTVYHHGHCLILIHQSLTKQNKIISMSTGCANRRLIVLVIPTLMLYVTIIYYSALSRPQVAKKQNKTINAALYEINQPDFSAQMLTVSTDGLKPIQALEVTPIGLLPEH